MIRRIRLRFRLRWLAKRFLSQTIGTGMWDQCTEYLAHTGRTAT